MLWATFCSSIDVSGSLDPSLESCCAIGLVDGRSRAPATWCACDASDPGPLLRGRLCSTPDEHPRSTFLRTGFFLMGMLRLGQCTPFFIPIRGWYPASSALKESSRAAGTATLSSLGRASRARAAIAGGTGLTFAVFNGILVRFVVAGSARTWSRN